MMAAKKTTGQKTRGARNEYRWGLERNEAGKQTVRIRARFARQSWGLSVYFLAPSRQHAARKLERVLRFLQLNEERLWFWGADRRDDPDFSPELLNDIGLKIDRRTELPERFSVITLGPDHPLGSDQVSLIRRNLTQSKEVLRPARS
jgi:hypothetical protein